MHAHSLDLAPEIAGLTDPAAADPVHAASAGAGDGMSMLGDEVLLAVE